MHQIGSNSSVGAFESLTPVCEGKHVMITEKLTIHRKQNIGIESASLC